MADADSAPLEDLAFLTQIEGIVPRLLAELPYRDRRILCGRFGLAGSPITMVADLAQELRMTCEGVSLGTDRLLRELRECLEDGGWSAEMFR